MSLQTGRRLRRYPWKTLSVPDEVINRVHKLARRNHAKWDILFYYRDGTIPISDIANDEHDEPTGVNNNENENADNHTDSDDNIYDPDSDSNASSDSDISNDSDDDDSDSDYSADSHFKRFNAH